LRLFDFEDMIMEVVRVLKINNDLLLRLQEKFQYILADEHQDANQGQNHILELLSGFFESPNLFIVGDEKQAIYRFQGASLENFLYFKKLYPHAHMISLVHNYRSTQTILDGAHSLISNNKIEDEKLRVKLEAHSSHLPQKIKIYPFTKAENEYLFLAHDIQKKLDDGIPAQEICVLFRDNKDVFPIIKVLEKTTIPFVVDSGQNILEDDQILKILRVLKAVNEHGNNEYLSEFLFIDFLNINQLDIYKLINFTRKEKKFLYDVMCCEEYLVEAHVEDRKEILNLYEKLSKWSVLGKNKNIVDFFEIIVRESGFLDHVFSLNGSLDVLGKLELLFNEIKKIAGNHKQYRLNDLMQYFATLEEHNVLIKIDRTGDSINGVRLMTAHKSKGLEFDYVYITGVCDGHWGNKRTMNSFSIPLGKAKPEVFDPIDDERRLFYVALTRARKEVGITWCKESLSKKEQLPSQFIEEIGTVLSEYINTSIFETNLPKDLSFTFAPKLNYGANIKDIHYLQHLFLDQGLSVTALNNYLKCPWNYFFENLVRIPRPQSKHQLYGTSVHETLKLFFDKYKIEEDLSKEELLTFFEDFLKRKPLEQSDYDESLEKGKVALGGYYDTYKNIWPRSLFTEFTVAGIQIPFEDENNEKHILKLRGQLDKIEVGEGSHVSVIDYKTRKPLSRNDIEGKTKTSKGDYKRQLVFYKLLLDSYDEEKYSMQTGAIDFIEPDEQGRYKKEVFEITQDEVRDLHTLVLHTAQEIYSMRFWDKTCEEKTCEYCRLRKQMEK
ncbi:MAG: ATP-dependent helicase, partial [bacterium]|nr:ATP-dependent helicase [bacterium]